MQLFLKLFGPYLQWVYHCFDRIVINGHLLGLMRENQVVYFFRDVCGHPKITKELVRQRSQDYQTWVEHFALNHKLDSATFMQPSPVQRGRDSGIFPGKVVNR